MRPDSNQRPNVIVFFTDQQRWDSTGIHGNPMHLTPNFDHGFDHGCNTTRLQYQACLGVAIRPGVVPGTGAGTAGTAAAAIPGMFRRCH